MARRGAPDGNKNAEKWTNKESHRLFDEAIELANTQYEYEKGIGFDYDFIGEIANVQHVYIDLYLNLIDRFPELRTKYEILKSKLASNCYANGKKGKIVPALSIMNLKSNHGWTDRAEIDHTTKGKEINSVITLPQRHTNDGKELQDTLATDEQTD